MSNYYDCMFNISLLHLDVKNWKNKKEKLLDIISTLNLDTSHGESVKTNYHFKENEQLIIQNNEKITNILKDEIEEFCNYFKFHYYKISMSWFEISSKGDYHGVHNHGSVGYSSVCFIEYDQNEHTPTQFISPFNNFITGEFLNYSPHQINEGSIIFFPSLLLHCTEPNLSNKNRTILSFNIDVKENHNQRPRYS